jgi:preprotein translocase subunit SecD
MQNKYPLWKNIMLIFIVIIGLIYAIPNLYTEEPAIAISPPSPVDMEDLSQRVSSLLGKAKINYYPPAISGDNIEVRFASPDIQLQARDVLKQGLDPHYTIALNLAPATPSWFSKVGAEPMKQGLDLRGGVHFLLEVDVDSVINRRYEGLMKSIGQNLREAGIRYSGIRHLVGKISFLTYRRQNSQQPTPYYFL